MDTPLIGTEETRPLRCHYGTAAETTEAAALDGMGGRGILSGLEAGMETVLVLTGVTTRAETERYSYRASRVADLVDELE